MATQTTTLPRGNMLNTSMSAAPLARPYKDFLTPALHRRFTHAAFLSLALCWLEATLMSSSPSWLWSWAPFGLTGIRTLLLFLPCLTVFIIRVMNLHPGTCTTASGVETFVQTVTSWRCGATVGWYVLGAWLFGETYIWSRSEEANLGWIDPGRAYERPRANENPVFLRSLFFLLALGKAGWHLYCDVDRLPIEEKEQTSQQQPALRQLSAQAGTIARRVVPFALCGTVLSFPVYFLLLRQPAWKYMAYPIARTLVRQLPAYSRPQGLINLTTLLWQALTSSAMLITLWDVSNAIFTLSVSQPPLKKGQPLTSEIKDAAGTILSRSRDPNGSLIRGLKAKNPTPKSFAFWELYLICTRFEARRKTIFADVDRKPDSTWSAISTLCLAEITAISTRIQTAQQPSDYQKQTAESALQRQQQEHLIAQQREQAFGLPKIASQKVQNDRDVFAKRGQVSTVGQLAKSLGQSPGAPNPVTPRAKRAIAWTEQQTGGRERWSIDSLGKEARGYATAFLKTPVGGWFRQTFARRVGAVVFGVPVSGKVNIVHASRSLARLAVASLKEDNYGQAARDVPAIIRTYVTTLATIEGFTRGLAPHWTDVMFRDAEDREIAEVREVVEVLREGLREVVLGFGEYAAGLGLSAKELREAKEVVGSKREREV